MRIYHYSYPWKPRHDLLDIYLSDLLDYNLVRTTSTG
jgi:hypothetical protein